MMSEETTARSAMKLALEALEEPHPNICTCFTDAITYREKVKQAITALREALTSVPDWVSEAKEQPAPATELREQEPVAWVCYGSNNKHDIDFFEDEIADLAVGTKLYTHAQRTWVDLTFAEICECENDYLHIFARAIEAKLKEKNT